MIGISVGFTFQTLGSVMVEVVVVGILACKHNRLFGDTFFLGGTFRNKRQGITWRRANLADLVQLIFLIRYTLGTQAIVRSSHQRIHQQNPLDPLFGRLINDYLEYFVGG